MALNGFEESSAWAISKAESGDIVKDAIRKEQVLKDITASQSDLRALVTRVHGVQADIEKLTSENATLQMYIDNLTLQMARRK
jgi:cell division protein FtsB